MNRAAHNQTLALRGGHTTELWPLVLVILVAA